MKPWSRVNRVVVLGLSGPKNPKGASYDATNRTTFPKVNNPILTPTHPPPNPKRASYDALKEPPTQPQTLEATIQSESFPPPLSRPSSLSPPLSLLSPLTLLSSPSRAPLSPISPHSVFSLLSLGAPERCPELTGQFWAEVTGPKMAQLAPDKNGPIGSGPLSA